MSVTYSSQMTLVKLASDWTSNYILMTLPNDTFWHWRCAHSSLLARKNRFWNHPLKLLSIYSFCFEYSLLKLLLAPLSVQKNLMMLMSLTYKMTWNCHYLTVYLYFTMRIYNISITLISIKIIIWISLLTRTWFPKNVSLWIVPD